MYQYHNLDLPELSTQYLINLNGADHAPRTPRINTPAPLVWDRSFIKGGGGAGRQNGREGVKFYPYEKGCVKSLSHAERRGEGRKKFWGSFNTGV